MAHWIKFLVWHQVCHKAMIPDWSEVTVGKKHDGDY
jgi:hypothetical protein